MGRVRAGYLRSARALRSHCPRSQGEEPSVVARRIPGPSSGGSPASGKGTRWWSRHPGLAQSLLRPSAAALFWMKPPRVRLSLSSSSIRPRAIKDAAGNSYNPSFYKPACRRRSTAGAWRSRTTPRTRTLSTWVTRYSLPTQPSRMHICSSARLDRRRRDRRTPPELASRFVAMGYPFESGAPVGVGLSRQGR